MTLSLESAEEALERSLGRQAAQLARVVGWTRRPAALVPAVALVVLAASVAACLHAATVLDVRAATDTGLVSLLPPEFWAGVAGLTVVFAVLLVRRSTPDWLLGACVVALVVAVFGLSVFASSVPRLNISFRHAGIIDELARTGHPDPRIDAYFNWPGFFMLGALLTEAAGFSTPLALTHLAPLYMNLLFLPPLLVLMRALTVDHRRIWLGAWIYYLGQWANQDYFAPQSYTYFLYLTSLAIVLLWFSAPPAEHVPASLAPEGLLGRFRALTAVRVPQRPLPATSRAALLVVVAALVLGAVPSHQLTPYALVIALGVIALALPLPQGRSVRTLTAVAVVGAAAWFLFAATAYVAGHLTGLVSDVGDVGASASANLGDRVQGSPGHLFVVYVRLALTAAVGLLAAVGVLLRRARGHWDALAVVLAAVAYVLVPLQPYGGEVLLRSYFFSLPFLAFLAAAAILPAAGSAGGWAPGRRWVVPVAVVALTAVLAPALVVSRYGNARVDQFTPQEVAVVSRMYEVAKPGSYLFALADNAPWKDEQYASHRYRVVANMGGPSASPHELAAHLSSLAGSTPAGGLLVVTRGQLAYGDLYGGVGRATERAVETELTARYHWRLVYTDRDGRLYASPTG